MKHTKTESGIYDRQHPVKELLRRGHEAVGSDLTPPAVPLDITDEIIVRMNQECPEIKVELGKMSEDGQ